jgi:endoglucanase
MARRRKAAECKTLTERRCNLPFVIISLLVAAILFGVYIIGRDPRYALARPDDKITIPFPFPHTPPIIQPPLRTRGRHIVDTNGTRVKLASINWYGASDELFVPSGLDVMNLSNIARTIRQLGFNSVRLPYSDEMVVMNPVIPDHILTANKHLVGSRALDVFVAVVDVLTDAGLAVIINNHITHATWCCGADPCDSAWFNDHLGWFCRISQTEDRWLENWDVIMSRFVNNSRVIGVDLRNEPRGLWSTMTWNKWAAAAERAGNLLLAKRPDWLVFVEGTSSSNDLSGVWSRPVVLDIPHRVVYSAHVYGWSGWGSFEGSYSRERRSYESFARAMNDNWGYILSGDIAPVWVGEIGAPHLPNRGDLHYWSNLVRYLAALDVDFAYWAINPRKPHGNTTETYSILKDDWKTPILDYRLRDMMQLMT